VSATGPDAQAPADSPAESPSVQGGHRLRGIATDMLRPKPRTKNPPVDPATAKKIVNGLDRRELTFASVTAAFNLFLVIENHTALAQSSNEVHRADAPDFLIFGLVAIGLIFLGLAVRRRALLGFALFIMGLDFLTYGLVSGFVLNAGIGGWLLFRVSKLQKRRALERGPSTRASRTRTPRAAARGGRNSPAVGRPKPSKRYTPPKRRPPPIPRP
jgi:hypothetical protein